jgi:hypothetical protein
MAQTELRKQSRAYSVVQKSGNKSNKKAAIVELRKHA